MIRLLAFFGVVLLGLFTPIWIWCIGVIIYVLVYSPGYEVLGVGVCIDALFGQSALPYWYLYTFFSILFMTSIVVLKPYIKV